VFYILLFSDVRHLVTPGLRTALWPLLLSLGITLTLPYICVGLGWKLVVATLFYLAGARFSGIIRKGDMNRLRSVFAGAFPIVR
jgi:hypothetical protein